MTQNMFQCQVHITGQKGDVDVARYKTTKITNIKNKNYYILGSYNTFNSIIISLHQIYQLNY